MQFVTSVEEYRVTDAPFAVPSRLNHDGLSGVICHLLAVEDAVPFDFFVDGVLLRTSLRKHMKTHGLSSVRVAPLRSTDSLWVFEPRAPPPALCAVAACPHCAIYELNK